MPRATNSLQTAATGGSSLRYESTRQQLHLQLGHPGPGCYTLFLTLDTGQVFRAYFHLS